MEIREPRIVVRNTDIDEWQISAEGLVSANNGLETVSFTVLVRKSSKSLPALTRQGAARAIALLQGYLDHAPEE